MKKILIVDDDRDFSSVMTEIFRAEGYATVTVMDGCAAVREFRSSSPHAVLLDHDMPGMRGLEALKEMKELNPSVPVIMLTGKGDAGLEQAASALGAFRFLCKPPDFTELVILTEQAVGGTPEG